MSFCINPSCPKPDHRNNDKNRFCQSCGSDLLLMGRYRVIRLLSDKSGFGNVYEVEEGNTPKILKVLKEDLNNNPKAVELFQQEAAVLGQLNNPGIPKVDGYFQLQTRNNLPLHCIVMEKIDGLNLEQWLQQRGDRPINQDQALDWLKKLTEILHLVHGKQYLHRDIKPSNIMLRQNGQLVLIDFGTAREMTYTYLAKVGGGHNMTAIESRGYTAPEQANGQGVPQSDFFSLGRTFVHLLTGKHPLDMYDAYNDNINWRSYASHISPLLLDFIDELMARELNKRPASTQDILRRIEEIKLELAKTLNVAGIKRFTTWLPNRSRGSKLPLIAFLGLFLLALGLLSLTALAFRNFKIPRFPVVIQTPQKKGQIDYFPYLEGADSKGRTAEFNIAVLSIEYKWLLGSNYQVRYNDKIVNIDALKSNLEQEGIRRIMENPSEIISVGTASCEGSPAQEERRAFDRAKQIQLLVKKLFSSVPSVKGYRLLNLGQFNRSDCQSNQDLTSYQRSIIIIGVKKQTPGVILDEALRDRLEKKPFSDFKLEDYSLGSQEKFKTIPSNL